jgi:hypothetical protein
MGHITYFSAEEQDLRLNFDYVHYDDDIFPYINLWGKNITKWKKDQKLN